MTTTATKPETQMSLPNPHDLSDTPQLRLTSIALSRAGLLPPHKASDWRNRQPVIGDKVYSESRCEFGTVYSVEDDGMLVVEMAIGRNFTPHQFVELPVTDCTLV